MMAIRQFDIWMADLNPRIGTEPGKVSPVLVIQTDLLNEHHPLTLVCPLTTIVKTKSKILRVHLPAGRFGLNEGSDMMIDQVRAIDNRRLMSKVGHVTGEVVKKIKLNLAIIFDLE